MTTPDLEARKLYYNRCDPAKPIPASDPERFYVDFDELGLRGDRCIDVLLDRLELSEGPTQQLFTGFPGSGKTTELFRLAGNLRDQGYLVVYTDAAETIDGLNPIGFADVLIALGLAVDRQLAELAKHGVVKKWAQQFGAEVWNLLSGDIKLGGHKVKFGNGPMDVELGIELKKNFSFRLALREAAKTSRRQILEHTRLFFEKAQEFVRSNGTPGGLVVILDNLEKLSGSEEAQQSARDLFLSHADALQAPGVHVVYTLPVRLIFSKAGTELGHIYDGDPLVLPMVKVRDRVTGELFEDGRMALKEALLRRLSLDEVFGGDEGLAELLVDHCGGYVRDLLRLARSALRQAKDLPLEEKHARSAIDELRTSYRRGISTDDFDLLRFIDANRPQNPIDEKFRERLEEVIVNHYALVQRNTTEWYEIHPLVRDIVNQALTNG
jgi:hypothetical protein